MAAQIEMLLPLPQWVIFISIFAVLLDHLLTICNIFCSFAAFGDTLWVLFFSLCFFTLIFFLLDLVWQKTFACSCVDQKKKLLLEMFCGIKGAKAGAGAGAGGTTYWAFWHSLATVFGGSCVSEKL